MPTVPDRRRPGRRLTAVGALVVTAVVAISGCGRIEPPMNPTTPTANASDLPATASPGQTGDPSASPGGSPSPAGGATPGGSVSPGASGTPTGSVAPVSCTSVTPIRIERSSVEPRRTTEVVTLVSDGRNLTPGTREQSAFEEPELTAPDAVTTITDEATLATVADLIEGSSRNTVLLTRPDPPDTGADANRRPFDATGTYVTYNASGLLSADVIVGCSAEGPAGAGGQEQRWRFTSEADPTTGTVNCAVEPPRSNAVARQVYGGFC